MEIQEFSEFVGEKGKKLNSVSKEVRKVIVGQDYVLNRLFLSLLSDGHVLLEGVPGLAKTMMVKTLAQSVKCIFKRIQFTPDLLPADLVGTKIYDQKTTEFITKKGPIFANFLLADEINRAPPKVQSALLEAMQERRVTISGDTYPLPKPFLVLATQNPIETEGTYPLPEAQVDRFMFKVNIDYPSETEEAEIIDRMTTGRDIEVKYAITPREIIELQSLVHRVYLDEKVKKYIIDIVFASRNPRNYGLDLEEIIQYGASPRASIHLTLAAKAHALMEGRGYVTPDDVKEVAPDVLRHRLILTYEALAEEFSVESIIEKLLGAVEVP
jgi:MoxR-like ATPase